MDRVLLALAIAAVVGVVAVVLQRRNPDPPTLSTVDFQAPAQLVRADFERPDAAWLVAVFTSRSCTTCADVWSKAAVMESGDVAVQEVEVGRDRDLHERYGIEAVPIVAIARADGAVEASFLGPVSSTHLWAALAELREPGSVPPGCGADVADQR